MADQHQQGRGQGIHRPLAQHVASARSRSSAQLPARSIEDSEPPFQQSSPFRATHTPPQTPVFRIPQSPRSATGESAAKSAKVAIPRLKKSVDATGEDATRSGGRHRVNHACEPCRHRKTKCSGERPVCRHCQDFKIACFYADGKRDRVKKYAIMCAIIHDVNSGC